LTKYQQPQKGVLLPKVLQLNQKVKEVLVAVSTEMKSVPKNEELIRTAFKQHFLALYGHQQRNPHCPLVIEEVQWWC